MKREVRTDAAPAPVGPYSQAVSHAGLLWASGQIPLDPATGQLVEGDIAAQARQAFRNLEAVLVAGGASLATLLRVSIYLTDLSLFSRVNAVYGRHFSADPQPARSTIQAAALPLGVAIEIDAIAWASRNRDRGRGGAADG